MTEAEFLGDIIARIPVGLKLLRPAHEVLCRKCGCICGEDDYRVRVRDAWIGQCRYCRFVQMGKEAAKRWGRKKAEEIVILALLDSETGWKGGLKETLLWLKGERKFKEDRDEQAS